MEHGDADAAAGSLPIQNPHDGVRLHLSNPFAPELHLGGNRSVSTSIDCLASLDIPWCVLVRPPFAPTTSPSTGCVSSSLQDLDTWEVMP